MLHSTTCRLATAAHRCVGPLLAKARQISMPETRVILFTYGELNEEHVRMDSINDVNMGQVLDIVHHTCAQYSLPDLAALVVSASTGAPGERYRLSASWQSELDRIRAYDWSKVGRLDVAVNLRMN